jgi:two-component system sensor histidine kinase/response regulator
MKHPPPAMISPEQLAVVWPFHVVVRADLTIESAGILMARTCPDVRAGASFVACFDQIAPAEATSFASLVAHRRSATLIQHRATGLLLLGRVLPRTDDRAVVLVSPQFGAAADLDRLGLTLEDLAAADTVGQLLTALEMQQTVNDELVQLTAVLRERKRQLDAAVAELERSREEARRLALIAERIDEGVLLTDLESRIQWANDGFTRMSGYTLAEVLGRRPGEFLHGPDTDREVVDSARTFQGAHQPFTIELINYHRDGHAYRVEIDAKPLLDATGTPIGYMALQRDVTERRRVEEAQREARELAESASLAKGQFVANMSHELRTPLNAITGLTALLGETALDAEQRDLVETLQSSSRALLGIVNEVLDFEKIEAGRLEIARERFDVWRLVQAVVAQHGDAARRGGIELGSVVAADVPREVEGDPVRLHQVLTNLLDNAVKFTSTGRVTVRIAHRLAEDGDRLRFEVEDTGIGIDPEVLPALFQPFTQADGSVARRFGGTGLGLAICRSLVELMGGAITVESTPGAGSRFSFTIGVGRAVPPPPVPARRVAVTGFDEARSGLLCEMLVALGVTPVTLEEAGAAPDAVVAPKARGEALAAWRRSGRETTRLVLIAEPDERSDAAPGPPGSVVVSPPIGALALLGGLGGAVVTREDPEPILSRPLSRGSLLLAEDNPTNQKVTRSMLQKHGWQVHVVGDGEAAVAACEANHYDAVIMDCQMPGVDGLTAARRIRALEGTAAHVPIIALTAGAQLADRRQCLAAGMDDYLAKPILPARLREVVDRWTEPAESMSLDGAVLKPYLGLEGETGEPLLMELVDVFAAGTATALTALRAALTSGDVAAVEHEAHRLKGGALAVGLTAVSRRCAHLESFARDGQLDGAIRHLAPLEAALAEGLPALRDAAADLLANGSAQDA